MGNYTCRKSTAQVYAIRVRKPYSTWADITIEEWDEGGSFKCISDFGNFVYAWTSIGDRCLRKFLMGLNFDYFMRKTRGKFEEFAFKETIKNMLNDVITMRREERSLTEETARQLWNQIKALEYTDNEDHFFMGLGDFILKELYDHDHQCIAIAEEPSGECKQFWDIIWPAACDIWGKELAEEEKKEEACIQ